MFSINFSENKCVNLIVLLATQKLEQESIW